VSHFKETHWDAEGAFSKQFNKLNALLVGELRSSLDETVKDGCRSPHRSRDSLLTVVDIPANEEFMESSFESPRPRETKDETKLTDSPFPDAKDTDKILNILHSVIFFIP
jgi:hypothetical protein